MITDDYGATSAVTAAILALALGLIIGVLAGMAVRREELDLLKRIVRDRDRRLARTQVELARHQVHAHAARVGVPQPRWPVDGGRS